MKIKAILAAMAQLIPLRNILIFESYPDFSDNTKAVFEEMLRRGYNTKYRMIWLTDAEDAHFKNIHIKNVKFLSRKHKLLCYYYCTVAKGIFVCNVILPKIQNKTVYFYLSHGSVIKDTRGKNTISKSFKNINALTLSPYMAQYDAQCLGLSITQMHSIGYPRNDAILKQSVDFKSVFNCQDADKFIYWLPTFRQHKKNGQVHSNIAMPILHNEKIAKQVNDCARKYKVFIVVKPHPSQDISKIQQMNLSNLRFIDTAFLSEFKLNNYALLGSSDALLTDYSSVYYDYLLADKPIGLCWEDFDAYKENEGIIIDPDIVMAGGAKIYNTEDLCGFIKQISNGEDSLKENRAKVIKLIHTYMDAHASERAVDLIEKNLSQL